MINYKLEYNYGVMGTYGIIRHYNFDNKVGMDVVAFVYDAATAQAILDFLNGTVKEENNNK